MRAVLALLLFALAPAAAAAPSCRQAERAFQRCSISGCQTLDRHDAMAQLLACASRRKSTEPRRLSR